MAFLMAGLVHLLYRLLFEEVNSFLSGYLDTYLSGPATGTLLLLIIYPIYRFILEDDRDPVEESLAPIRGHSSAFLQAILLGLATGMIVWFIALFWPDTGKSTLPPWQGIVAIVLWTPVVEEIYYRFLLQGFLMRSMKSGGPSALALFLPLIFATGCFIFSHDYFIAPVLLIPSLAFGLIFIKWNVTAATVSHAVYNAVLIGGTYVSQNQG
tara:strand:- start:46771 stop:47403 length:633 start_codon:yes stop_codon:yes gene_type:complete